MRSRGRPGGVAVADPGRTDPLSARAHRGVVGRIRGALPEGCRIMVIGGGSMMDAGVGRVITTKDEDVVLLLVEAAEARVADVPVVEALVRALGAEPEVRKDQTGVRCVLHTDEGRFLLEFVRGRKAGGGYFVSRAVLERVASHGADDGQVLEPPLEGLAFLKAWAAVDKAKLVRAEKDPHGYHAARERAFRDDVAAVLRRVLESRQVEGAVVADLLGACGKERARAVRAVLVSAGWPLDPLSGTTVARRG